MGQAYYWIGRANYETGANANAVGSYTKSLSVYPSTNTHDIYLDRGKAYAAWGASTYAVDPEGGKELLNGAFSDFDTAISQYPTREAYLLVATQKILLQQFCRWHFLIS